jgi:hypothetical protein
MLGVLCVLGNAVFTAYLEFAKGHGVLSRCPASRRLCFEQRHHNLGAVGRWQGYSILQFTDIATLTIPSDRPDRYLDQPYRDDLATIHRDGCGHNRQPELPRRTYHAFDFASGFCPTLWRSRYRDGSSAGLHSALQV